MTSPGDPDVAHRARLSLGRSHQRIYRIVADVLGARAAGVLADVGCGSGELWLALRGRFRPASAWTPSVTKPLPPDVAFHAADLRRAPLPDACVDVAAAVEVIEHLENPRAFVRELARIVRPGGWVVITTPNQLSALSLLTLVVKGRFSGFQDTAYPAHRTALLEIDLRRILSECGLRDLAVTFTRLGRLPLSPWHYPDTVAALAPRRLSDNIVIVGRR